MKAKQIIGAIIAIIGIFAAVCVTDESNYEMAIRFGGIAMFAIGAYMAKAFDFQTSKTDEK